MIDNLEFHHIGVATRDIEVTGARYQALGYVQGPTIHDPLQNIRISFLTHPQMPMVELLSPCDDKSPVVRILDSCGTTPYHTCYQTPDLEASIKEFKRERYVVVVKPKVACAIEGRRVAFLFHPEMGLVELVEK